MPSSSRELRCQINNYLRIDNPFPFPYFYSLTLSSSNRFARLMYSKLYKKICSSTLLNMFNHMERIFHFFFLFSLITITKDRRQTIRIELRMKKTWLTDLLWVALLCETRFNVQTVRFFILHPFHPFFLPSLRTYCWWWMRFI